MLEGNELGSSAIPTATLSLRYESTVKECYTASKHGPPAHLLLRCNEKDTKNFY